jgi:predicted GIY-YIG superfamily endonuclease
LYFGDAPLPSWVYILECADGSYYTGSTTHIEQRIGQHKAGVIPGYTSTRLPIECVYVAEFQRIHEAIAWERTIKRWSRAKKEALIAGAYDRLPELARNYQHHGGPARRYPASFDTAPAGPAQDDDLGER